MTSRDLNLPEASIVPPLRLPPELDNIVEDITSNVMNQIAQQSVVNPPEMIVDINQASDTETIYYIEDDWIGDMLPEETDAVSQGVLDSLAIIEKPSPPPQDDELLPEVNQDNKCETITINDDNDDDIDFTISRTVDGVEITN